jgi:predicted lipoprotein with Yx(FWY)xxD motif
MIRKRVAVLAATAATGLTLLTACGGATGGTQPALQQEAPPAAPVSLLTAEVGPLGEVLTDAKGFTLYRFDEDTANPSVSNCDDACAQKWPAVIVDPENVAVQGVEQSLVGTVARKDGTKQLTIAGWPMYNFTGDAGPGEWKGHGVGGTWFASTPLGKKASGGAAAGPELKTAVVPGLGTVLTNSAGLTLYRFDADSNKPPSSTCVGDCAAKWPPLVATADPVRVQGVDQELVATLVRPDGAKQVTVGGWPLYTFAQDEAPGDAKGQGVGGTWFAAAPDGKKAVQNTALKLTTATVGDLGVVATDAEGMTLYRFDEDTANPSVSNCDDACAVKWPPLLTETDDVQVQGIDQALVGTVARADGTKQITLAGWPLYTFADDVLCGDAKGQGVGGTWFVSTPEGKKAGV